MSLLVILPNSINICIVALQCNFAHAFHLNKITTEDLGLRKGCILASLLTSLHVQIKPRIAPTSATLLCYLFCELCCPFDRNANPILKQIYSLTLLSTAPNSYGNKEV